MKRINNKDLVAILSGEASKVLEGYEPFIQPQRPSRESPTEVPVLDPDEEEETRTIPQEPEKPAKWRPLTPNRETTPSTRPKAREQRIVSAIVRRFNAIK